MLSQPRGRSAVRVSLLHQAPAALRSAGRASRRRSGRRSCLRPAPPGLRRRAPTCETGRVVSREPRSAATLKACLRRGRSGSEMAGAPSRSAGRSSGVRGELPSRLPSTQAEPSRRGPWRPGRSYSGALHLDARNHARSTVCGSTADGMRAGVSGGLRWPAARSLARLGGKC
jgi:hypothetical protein